jgi:hypothetical protein
MTDARISLIELVNQVAKGCWLRISIGRNFIDRNTTG